MSILFVLTKNYFSEKLKSERSGNLIQIFGCKNPKAWRQYTIKY